jgi:hypothetical protein
MPSPPKPLPRPTHYFDKRKLVLLAFLANVVVASKKIQLVSLSLSLSLSLLTTCAYPF